MTTAAKGSFVDNDFDDNNELEEDFGSSEENPEPFTQKGLQNDIPFDNDVPQPDAISLEFELPRKLKMANSNFDRFDREQSTWIRVAAYHMMLVDGADQPTIQERFEGLNPAIVASWKRDAELNLSKFVQVLVADMKERPQLYTPENILLSCKRQGVFDEDGKFISSDRLAGDELVPAKSTANGQLKNRSTPQNFDPEVVKQEQKELEARVMGKVPVADMGALLLMYLNVSLETLAIQAEFMKDITWLRGQKAGDLALLHNAMSDHVLKILEAMAAATQNPLEITPGTVDDIGSDNVSGTSPATSVVLEGETREEASQNHDQSVSP